MVHLLVTALLAYLAIGMAVGLVFLLVILDRIDPQAHGSYAFRPLLLPGLVLLWPVVVARSVAKLRGVADPLPSQRANLASHLPVWTVVAVVIVVGLAGGFALRQYRLPEQLSVRISSGVAP
jgi:uncharacterized membrane protein